MQSKAIDVHIHCSELPDDGLLRFAQFNGLKYTLEEILSLMEKHGVERGLLLSPPLNDGSSSPNERTIKLCRESRGKLDPVITVDPGERRIEAALEIAKKEKENVRAFKIRLGYVEFFAYNPVFNPLYDYAQANGLPVMFHTGDTATSTGSLAHSHPLTLDRLASSRPDLTIVICHFGNPWIVDAAELIYKHQRVFADISGLVAGDGAKYAEQYMESLAARLSEAIYFAGGADKVLFGSDYPVEPYHAAFSLVSKLKIDEGDVGKILYENAEKVFFKNQ